MIARWGSPHATWRRADPAGRCGGGVRGLPRPGVGAARGRRRRPRELGSPSVDRLRDAVRPTSAPPPRLSDRTLDNAAVDRPRQVGRSACAPSARPSIITTAMPKNRRYGNRRPGGSRARPRTLPNAIAPVLVGVGAAALDNRVVVAFAARAAGRGGSDHRRELRQRLLRRCQGHRQQRVGRYVWSVRCASAKAVLGAALGLFLLAALFGLVLVLASGQWWLLLVGACASRGLNHRGLAPVLLRRFRRSRRVRVLRPCSAPCTCRPSVELGSWAARWPWDACPWRCS